MTFQAYDVRDPHDSYVIGAVIVDPDYDCALPISIKAFAYAEEAERFLIWLERPASYDLFDDLEVARLIKAWRDEEERYANMNARERQNFRDAED